MDEFEYLAALVSVVAGLSLTRALSGFAKLFDSGNNTRMSGVHAAWTLSIVVWLVGFWWFTFMLESIDNWTISLLFFVLLYGAVIYVLIALLYPDELKSGTDLLEIFISRRRAFFMAFLVLATIDLADTLIKTRVYELPGPPIPAYWLLIIFMFGVGIVGILTANRLIHRIIAYSWLGVIALWNVTTLVAL
jgi:hypothetical protein